MTLSFVETYEPLPCDAETAWETVCFYENVGATPPLFLRLVLPTPNLHDGCFQMIGDVSRCMYSDGGYLTKIITKLEHGRRVEFAITEQTIRYHRHVPLYGGYIEIVPGDEQQSFVRMVTRFENRLGPKTVTDLFVRRVIRAVHLFVIGDMRESLANEETGVVRSNTNRYLETS